MGSARSSPESKQWGRRYVKVDDMRGTIGYAHHADSKPREVLALQDVLLPCPAQQGVQP